MLHRHCQDAGSHVIGLGLMSRILLYSVIMMLTVKAMFRSVSMRDAADESLFVESRIRIVPLKKVPFLWLMPAKTYICVDGTTSGELMILEVILAKALEELSCLYMLRLVDSMT